MRDLKDVVVLFVKFIGGFAAISIVFALWMHHISALPGCELAASVSSASGGLR